MSMVASPRLSPSSSTLEIVTRERKPSEIFKGEENIVNTLGLDIINSLPIVSSETLGLRIDDKYPQVKPENMPGPAVVGEMIYENHSSRPFIAILVVKKAIRGPGKPKLSTYVEFFFRRYAYGLGNYVGSPNNPSYLADPNDPRSYDNHSSFIYGSGGMRERDWEQVKDLLKGKTLTDVVGSGLIYKLQMVRPKKTSLKMEGIGKLTFGSLAPSQFITLFG